MTREEQNAANARSRARKRGEDVPYLPQAGGRPFEPLVEHGTRKSYSGRHKCRCEPCVAANKEFQKAWRDKTGFSYAEYTKLRCKTDPAFKILRLLRSRLGTCLKLSKTRKTIDTMILLGCSLEHFMWYLAKKFNPGMTWENHGVHGWHVDHKKPCALFDMLDTEEQRRCFHFSNLQPLWGSDNLSKGTKWNN